MSLKERLMTDLQDAMRNKDITRRRAIRLVRADVKNAEIELQREATDEEIIQIISRDMKKRSEAIEMFERGRRPDLVAQERAEMKILTQYLPEQMSREQIAEVLHEIVDALGAEGPSSLGPVMRQAMDQLRGKADGRLVNQIAREILSQ